MNQISPSDRHAVILAYVAASREALSAIELAMEKAGKDSHSHFIGGGWSEILSVIADAQKGLFFVLTSGTSHPKEAIAAFKGSTIQIRALMAEIQAAKIQ